MGESSYMLWDLENCELFPYIEVPGLEKSPPNYPNVSYLMLVRRMELFRKA